MNGTLERLDSADRWLRAGLDVCGRAGGIGTIEVDMSEAEKLRKALRRSGVRVTYVHQLTRAVALVLKRDRSLHQLVSGNTRWNPQRVNVGVSVAGKYVIAPVLIIKDAANLSLQEIGKDLHAGVRRARADQETMMNASRRWGWMIPFAFMRRFILKKVMRYTQFGNEGAPTVQVTCLRGLRMTTPLLLGSMVALGAGGIENRVVAVDGRMEIKPMLTLSASMDHKAWDGLRVESFLLGIKRVLESDELWRDVRDIDSLENSDRPELKVKATRV